MLVIARAGAVSHVGKVRSNNQDSGFVGTHLFVVADGMGGHAGGDVASAIAVKHFAENDEEYSSTDDAQHAMTEMLLDANSLITGAVEEHSELRGMGTTVSALSLVGQSLVLAHIGDSRVYRFREGSLVQMTVDHTFVQRLVDAGRITPEEALTHPRRSVLMRVLGDVETRPDVDTEVFDIQEGDRWLLCSDGLSSYVDEPQIERTLARMDESSREISDDLVQLALDNGAPDNVTVVLLEIGTAALEPMKTRVVGSAANPLRYSANLQKRSNQIIPSILHPLRRPAPRPQDEEFVPFSDEALQELVAEDKRRKRLRQLSWLAASIVFLAAVAGAGLLAYNWTQQQYYVGENVGYVAVYQGVQQGIGPITLHELTETTDIKISSLPEYQQSQVDKTISAGDREAANEIVERLRDAIPE